MTTFQIIDAPMGAGKTTAISNELNKHKDSTEFRFIFITPYLKEVERLHRLLFNCVCFIPTDKDNKTQQVIKAIQEGKNIITTHYLFTSSEMKIADVIQSSSYSYHLIIDEEYPCFEAIHKVGVSDYPSLDEYQLLKESNWIKEADTGLITWIHTEKVNLCNTFKTKCETKEVYFHNNFFITLTNKHIWEVFSSIKMLSYRVRHSTFGYYCKLHGFETQYYHIEDDTIKEGYKESYPIGLTRIKLDDSYTVEGKHDLSKSWYTNTKHKEELKTIKKKTSTFLRKFPTNKKMWCTFKSYISSFTDKNISKKDYVSCNLKATNDHQDKIALAYLVNRFMNPIIVSFLDKHDIKVDQNEWALNELLQLIWRTNIRVPINTLPDNNTQEDNTIHLFIPSLRMRTLLEDWIERGTQTLYINKNHK